jgi:hypothetical protein
LNRNLLNFLVNNKSKFYYYNHKINFYQLVLMNIKFLIYQILMRFLLFDLNETYNMNSFFLNEFENERNNQDYIDY